MTPVRPFRIRLLYVPVDTFVHVGSFAVLPATRTIVRFPLTVCSVLGGTLATLTLPSCFVTPDGVVLQVPPWP